MVAFSTSNISAAQTTAYCCFDTFSTEFHCSAHCLFHCTTESYTVFQIQCDSFSNQLSVCFGSFDFFDVHSNLLACHLLDFSLQFFDCLTIFTDYDTGFCCIYANLYAASCSFDSDFGNACCVEFLFDEFSDFNVFYQVISKVFFSIPFGIPVFDDTDS